ncbi:MAG: MBL fold metallo-hydrolase, partial [Patescibacteria group bacterium]
MLITPLGGAQKLGGHCLLLEIDSQRILVDCGSDFDPEMLESSFPGLDSLDHLDFVMVSHGHIGSIGALPRLVQQCPTVRIITTLATARLIKLTFEYQSSQLKGIVPDPEIPRYPDELINLMISRLAIVQSGSWGSPFQNKGIECCFHACGHIAGAASILLRTPSERIMVTGDFTLTDGRVIPGMRLPDFEPDILVTEATYGGLVFQKRHEQERLLIQNIELELGRGGSILFPVTAVGRAQELIATLAHWRSQCPRLSQTTIVVDGMVGPVVNLYRELGFLTDQTIEPLQFFVGDNAERKKMVDQGGRIIICSSVSMMGCTSHIWASIVMKEERNAIFVPEAIDEESVGDCFSDLPINCPVIRYKLAQ